MLHCWPFFTTKDNAMNTATQTSPLVDTLREWVEMVSGGSKIKQVVTPHTQSDSLLLMEKALLLPAWFGRKGVKCVVYGSSDVIKRGFRVAVGVCEFHVNPVQVPFKGKRPQAVTATSREAYRSINLDTLQREVVKAALEMGETYDRALADKIGKGPNDVSARRNELEKGDFDFNGKVYRIEYHIQKASLHTGKRVQWWRIVEANAQQTLFQ